MSLPFSQEQIDKFWAKVDKTPGYGKWGDCWRWKYSKNEKGYGKLNSKIFGTPFAHRVSSLVTYGYLTPGLQVCHHCSTPDCTSPTHLYEGTGQDNMIDKVLDGNVYRMLGEDNPNSKINWDIVNDIRASYDTGGVYMKDLTKKYGLARKNVNLILKNKLWRDPSYQPKYSQIEMSKEKKNEIIRLRTEEKLTYPEIARRTNTNKNTVSAVMRRCRERTT